MVNQALGIACRQIGEGLGAHCTVGLHREAWGASGVRAERGQCGRGLGAA